MHSSKPKHETASPSDLRVDVQTSPTPQAVDDAHPVEQAERTHRGTIEYWYFCDGTSSLRW